MGRSGSASPGALPPHATAADRELLNPHGWLALTQAQRPAASWGVRTNRRVNLIRSRSGFGPSSQTAHRLRAVR